MNHATLTEVPATIGQTIAPVAVLMLGVPALTALVMAAINYVGRGAPYA